MIDAVAEGAIRRLTIDIANLTGQLAVAQAEKDFLRQAATLITPDSWDKVMVDDDTGHPEMAVTIRGDQVECLMRFLSTVESLD